MEGENFIVCHRCEPALFVKLTTSKGGRKQWEFTPDFQRCTKFKNTSEIDTLTTAHHVSVANTKTIPYENAHGAWMAAGAETEDQPKRRKLAF